MSLVVKEEEGVTILWPRLPWNPVPLVLYGIVTISMIYCIAVGKIGAALILSLFWVFVFAKWATAYRTALFHKNKQIELYGGFRGRKLLTRLTCNEIDHIIVSSTVLQFRKIGNSRFDHTGGAGNMGLYTPVIALKTTDPQNKNRLKIDCNFQTTEIIAQEVAFRIGEFADVPVLDGRGKTLISPDNMDQDTHSPAI